MLSATHAYRDLFAMKSDGDSGGGDMGLQSIKYKSHNKDSFLPTKYAHMNK
jgi:hypothetical protein